MKRRWISLVLVLTMMLSMVPIVKLEALAKQTHYCTEPDTICGELPYAYRAMMVNSEDFFVTWANLYNVDPYADESLLPYDAENFAEMVDTSLASLLKESCIAPEQVTFTNIIAGLSSGSASDLASTEYEVYRALLWYMLTGVAESDDSELQQAVDDVVGDILTFMDTTIVWDDVLMPVRAFINSGLVPNNGLRDLLRGLSYNDQTLKYVQGGTTHNFYTHPKLQKIYEAIRNLFGISDDVRMDKFMGDLVLYLQILLEIPMETNEMKTALSYTLYIHSKVGPSFAEVLDRMVDYTDDLTLRFELGQLSSLIRSDDWKRALLNCIVEGLQGGEEAALGIGELLLKARGVAAYGPYALLTGGMAVINLLMGRAAQAESAYVLLCTNEIDRAMVGALEELDADFKTHFKAEEDQKAATDATYYISAATMCLRMLEKEYEFCTDYFDAVYDTGVLTKIFQDRQEFHDWEDHVEYRIGYFKGIEKNIFGPAADNDGSWVRHRYRAHVDLIEKGMKVTYDLNGGIGDFADQTKAYNLHMPLHSGMPEKEGFAFGGWKPTIEGKQIADIDFWYDYGHTSISPYINPCYFADEILLTAQWVDTEANITYDANGGSGAPAAHTNTVGSTQLALNIPVFEDHTFLGWAEDPNALAPSYGAGALLPAEKEGAITLYAVWRADLIDITYNYGNDLQNPTIEQEVFNLSENDQYYVKPPKAGTENNNGSAFLGWMMENPDGDLWWADGKTDKGSYTLVQPNTFLQPIRDTELHAKWAWFLHYDYGNDLFIHDSVAEGAEVVLPEPVHRKDGYTFYGWTVTGVDGYIGLYQPGETILPSSDLQLRADWTQRTFELDGTVCDQAGNPLADVIVESFDADGNSIGATLTDSAGSYTFRFTKAGTYKRVFHKIGFASRTIKGLVVDERISHLGQIELTEGVSDLADGGRCGKQAAWALDKNDNLYILGTGAMFDYEYYYNVPWRTYYNQVASITVGEGITRIGHYAFYNMYGTNGIRLTLPETLISIGAYAFFGFHADGDGRELDLPQRLETIGERAFETGSFTRIGIGRNVSQIGYRQTDARALVNGSNPFGNNLVAIDVDPANRNFASVDGVLYTKDLTTLLAYPPARKSDTLILPETLTEIKSYAFNSMQAYNNLKNIGISAAMTDADALHSAFDDRPIECFTVSSRNPEFCAEDGVIFSKDHKTLVLYPPGRPEPRYQVPARTEVIGSNAFVGCTKLITLDLTRGLTTIESNAIYDCPLLYHLIIPETVNTIESNAFRLYSNTTFDLYFKGDVPENFGWYVADYDSEYPGTLYYARGAEGWTSPTWTEPNGGFTYDTAPFNPETLDLSIIESGTLDNGLQWAVDQDGALTISGSGPMEDMEYSDQQPWIANVRSGLGMAIRKVIVEDGITSIGAYAFCSMENLKEVIIGDTVTTIGGMAFYDCASLTNIELPDPLETIGNYVFADCSNLTSIVLPDGLQSIGGWAFENCTALTALELPNSVKTIDVGSFENCTSLTSMELPDGLESISQDLFKGCASLESVSIPDTVDRMGHYAFEGCCSLVSIDLPIGIQYIGRSVFKDCSALTSVTLPDTLWQIQEYAFNSCSSLTSIIIPKSVNQIHEYAFSGADQLNAIYFKGDVPRIMEAQALGSRRDAVIYYVAGTKGWTSPTWTMPDGGEVFKTATWKPLPTVTVTYDYGDDPAGENTTVEQVDVELSLDTYYTIQSPVVGKETYNGNTFKGWMMPDTSGELWWATSGGDNGKYTLYNSGQRIELSADLDFYAKWTWFIHFDHGDGRYTHEEAGEGAPFEIPMPSYTKEGLAFSHWTYTTEEQQTTICKPGDILVPHSDMVLTAVWKEATTTTLTGTVINGTTSSANYGQPIENAVVEFFDESGTSIGAVVTDRAGQYYFSFPANGTYKRVFRAIGFNDLRIDGLTVEENTATLDAVALKESRGNNYLLVGSCGDMAAYLLSSTRTLTIIGAGRMQDYGAASPAPWKDENIYKIVMEDGITHIGAYAFYQTNGTSQTKVTFSKTLRSIGPSAFEGLGSQYVNASVSLTLPEQLEYIGQNAFTDSSIYEVHLGRNVRLIGCTFGNDGTPSGDSNPFGNKTKNITIDPDNRWFTVIDGVLYTKDATTLLYCPAARKGDSLMMPDTVSAVKSYAMDGVVPGTTLKHISISAYLTDLSAFDNGRAYESFTVSPSHSSLCSVDGVVYSKDQKTLILYPPMRAGASYRVLSGTETIGSGAFVDCDRLVTLDFPDSLTTLSSGAIQNCSALYNLVIPGKVNTLRAKAIVQTGTYDNPYDVYFMGGIPEVFDNAAIQGVGALCFTEEVKEDETQKTSLDRLMQRYDIQFFDPADLDLSIAASGTAGSNLQWKIDCEGTLTISGNGEMPYYQPYNYPWICGSRAGFRTAVRKVLIEDGITSVNQYAFREFSSLEKVELADTVVSIDNSAFQNCSNLFDLTLSAGLKTIGYSVFSNCTSLQQTKLPEGLESINSSAFFGCDSLTAIVIPNTVHTLGNDVFYSCDNLTSAVLPAQLKAIPDNLFRSCEKLTTIEIPDTVESIGEGAFSWCDALTEVDIPDSVHTIGAEAFYGCDNLKEVKLPDKLEAIADGVFESCTALTTVDIPDTVKDIGENAFSGCSSLKTIDLPEGLETIESYVFSGCDSLEAIVLPDSLTAISDYAFYGCTALEEIVFPARLISIGSMAFYATDNLTAFYFFGDVPASIGSMALGDNYSRDAMIYYVAGTNGWTSPTWRAPKGGGEYRTATWKPRPASAVQEISVPANDQRVIITMDEEAEDVTQVLVGAYDPDTNQFIGSAIGNYTSDSNIVTVTFNVSLPTAYELRVFCTDDAFAPLYKVSSFVK